MPSNQILIGVGISVLAAELCAHRINDLIGVLLRFPLIPAIKRVLSWGGIECGEAVKPRRALTAAEEYELRAGLDQLELPAAFLK